MRSITSSFDDDLTHLHFTSYKRKQEVNGKGRIMEETCRRDSRTRLDAIRKLGRLVLTENVFVCGDKYYKQIIGDAMGSPFTLTLANIFMWHWQKDLVRRQVAANEIYGR